MEKKQYPIGLVIKSVLLTTLLLSFFACSSKDQAKLTLNIEELKNDKMTVEEQRVSGTKVLNTEEINSRGKVNYKFELDQPTFYNLKFEKGKSIYLILHPEDKVKITGTNNDPVIEGSEESRLLNELYDSLYTTRGILDKYRAEYEAAKDTEEKEKIYEKYLSVSKGYYKYSLRIILDNLSSMVSLAAVYQELGPGEFLFGGYRDIQYFKLVSDSLIKYYPKHRHVLALNRNYKQMMESYQLERLVASAGIEENSLPELFLPSVKGDSVSLLNMRSRYVLVNFWTHYMPNAQDYLPKLKSVRKKYKAKGFDIYNVYVGNSFEAWEKAIRFEEISEWTNVADTSFPFSLTRGKYNVTDLPANYLLDIKNEEILGKNLAPDQLLRSMSLKLD